MMYPRRAAEIRACGGIPPTATYGLPDPETVRALIASTSPILQQIDQEYAVARPGLIASRPSPRQWWRLPSFVIPRKREPRLTERLSFAWTPFSRGRG